MSAYSRAHRTKQRIAGFILVDALIGVFILVLAVLSYLSLTIVTHRSQDISKNETKAAQMVARLLEQVQLLKPSDINSTTLKAMNLVDANSYSSPYSFTNIPLDQGSGYSPSQVLRNGAGVMNTSTLANGSVLITATITWKSSTGQSRSFKSGTILGAYR